MCGGPIPVKVVKKIDLSKLSDKELRQKVSYGKYFVVKTTMAAQKMSKEFNSLVKYFTKEWKNLKKDERIFIGLMIKSADEEINGLIKSCGYNNNNLKKVEKSLKKNGYNKTVLELVCPQRSYYYMKLLGRAKELHKDGKSLMIPTAEVNKIGDDLVEWFNKLENATKNNKAARSSK